MSFEGFKITFSRNGSGRVLSNYLPNTSSTLLSPLPMSTFSSSFPPSVKRKMEGRSETGWNELFDQNTLVPRSSTEEGYEYDNTNSGSDNLYAAGGSAEEQMAASEEGESSSRRRKKYHRHTPDQIQELETFFKTCPHPDEKQRMELSDKLGLESRQVKFWFQNRRTHMKTQSERHENIILKQKNEQLLMENRALKEALINPTCKTCGGPAVIGDFSIDIGSLRVDNSRLTEELNHVVGTTKKIFGEQMMQVLSDGSNSTNPVIQLEIGMNRLAGSNGGLIDNIGVPIDSTALMRLGFSAFSEVMRLNNGGHTGIWIRVPDGSERLNYQDYLRLFPPCIGSRPGNFVTEASRQTGIVYLSSLGLVETLMDVDRWKELFPCLIARAATTCVVSKGLRDGTPNGSVQLMQAEMHVLSGFVPVRQVQFVRFCKVVSQGVWAVIDVSVDSLLDAPNAKPYPGCRKLPSGCILADMPNGGTQVTWIEHWEYDETLIHPAYRQLIETGMGFGATRWFSALQRQCQSYLAMLPSEVPAQDHSTAISSNGKKSMYGLVNRMMSSFCSGISGSSVLPWKKVHPEVTGDDEIRMLTRIVENNPGEPGGVVLSATTSLWLPVRQQLVFDFLRDDKMRSKWDILTSGDSIEEALRIHTNHDHGNAISLLRVTSAMPKEGGMLILQETWVDPSGSVIVYAPVDFSAMHSVLYGGDPGTVSILPSGFAILPDGSLNNSPTYGGDNQYHRQGGCLLTIVFQILVHSQPMAKVSIESIQTINTLIHCTVDKIKSAMQFS